MNLLLEIPDDVAKRLAANGGDLSRRALEALALEEYRCGRLTRPDLRRLLGFATRAELDAFLKVHEVFGTYTAADLEQDRRDLQRLGLWAWIQVVIADTGPLNYLVQINAIDLLPAMFGRILVPAAVRDELVHSRSPAVVRAWITQMPSWLEVRPNSATSASEFSRLDEGERAAIALATMLRADLILMDDRDGVGIARSRGFAVTGTLGVLDLAAHRRLINLAEAFGRLKATSFHYRQGLLDALLARQPRDTE